MKKTASLLLGLFFVTAYADDNNNNNNNNNNRGNRMSAAENCVKDLKNAEKNREDWNALKTANKPLTAKQLIAIDRKRPAAECEKLQIASWVNKENLLDQDSKPTMDNKARCDLRAGYTLDFNDCKLVRDMYNAVMFAEQAMFKQQQIRQDIQNKEAQTKVATASANGNLQEAAYNATIEKNKQLAALNKEQAATYSAAVLTLAGGISAWQGKGDKTLGKMCTESTVKTLQKYSDESGMDLEINNKVCTDALKFAADSHRSTTFANDTAKGYFIGVIGDLLKKAAEAKRRAGLTDDAAKKMAAAMPQDQFVDDALLEKCALYPNLPECKTSGPKSPGSNFQGTTFSMDGGGSNAFDLNPVGDSTTTTDEEKKIAEGEVLAPTSSPFDAEAKAANDIIDAAAAASVTPGSAGAPMGGGGGAGGGGGGGAAGGGNGGAEEEDAGGEAEIKSNKYTANYGGGSSKGFEGVKNAKEDANPFASLFDAKKEGGEAIEEDRSIASENNSLGLFDKISKGYQKAYESKQIEANNLE